MVVLASVIDRVRKSIDELQTRGRALRRSLLSEAFAGRLAGSATRDQVDRELRMLLGDKCADEHLTVLAPRKIIDYVFESGGSPLSVGALRRLKDRLADLDQDTDDSLRIDRIRVLEELKAAAAAAQARKTAAFVRSQRAEQAAQGVPEDRANRGIALQVALSRRISHHQAQRYVGWSMVLTFELPQTFRQLRHGSVPEWRAMVVAQETIWLSREHRAAVDAELGPQLEHFGDKRVQAEAKKLAYRLDPQGFVDRMRGAAKDRCVGLRPAPDTMSRLTGYLPVAQGVAAYAALRQDADAKIAQGDTRGRGQIMADTMVERITGQTQASDVPVEINLVMTDAAMFGGETARDPDLDTGARCAGEDGGADEPAHLDGYGPIPAEVARDIVFGASDHTPMWLRRLFRHPLTGELVAMESTRRCFTGGQRRFLRLRDQVCRTPWCEAPIRHADHITAVEQGGETTVANGDGQCAACNYAKEAPGWSAVAPPISPNHHEFCITTPTGHRYRSRAPAPPGCTNAIRPLIRNLRQQLKTA